MCLLCEQYIFIQAPICVSSCFDLGKFPLVCALFKWLQASSSCYWCWRQELYSLPMSKREGNRPVNRFRCTIWLAGHSSIFKILSWSVLCSRFTLYAQRRRVKTFKTTNITKHHHPAEHDQFEDAIKRKAANGICTALSQDCWRWALVYLFTCLLKKTLFCLYMWWQLRKVALLPPLFEGL